MLLQPCLGPVPSDTASNLHFCFTAPTREAVDAFHVAALGTGGADNGAPGLRPDYRTDYYAAFALAPRAIWRERRRGVMGYSRDGEGAACWEGGAGTRCRRKRS